MHVGVPLTAAGGMQVQQATRLLVQAYPKAMHAGATARSAHCAWGQSAISSMGCWAAAGTLDQRWEQLRESYEFVNRVAARSPTGKAPYRASRVKREADGTLSYLESWASLGPGQDNEAIFAEAVAGALVGCATSMADTPSFAGAGVQKGAASSSGLACIAPGAQVTAAGQVLGRVSADGGMEPSASPERRSPVKRARMEEDHAIVYMRVSGSGSGAGAGAGEPAAAGIKAKSA